MTRPSLPEALADATDVAAAGQAVVDAMVADGFAMPSIYLLRGGRLRCQAVRGYFQIVDGFPPGVGVMGRVIETGRAVVIPDAQAHPDFVAATSDLRGEATVPVWVHDEVIGVVNVETQSALPDDVEARLTVYATCLAARIEELGGMPAEAPAEQVAAHVVALAGLTDTAAITQRAVEAAVSLSAMCSAVLARRGADPQLAIRSTTGPLAMAAQTWTHDELAVIEGLVAHGASSYFVGGQATRSVASALVDAGVGSVIVLPLVNRGVHDGFLLVADTVAFTPDTDLVRWLEQLAVQASTMAAVTELIDELAEQAVRDPLTGLGNAAAFAAREDALRTEQGDLMAVLMIDFDHFKRVNDTQGHLAGDRLLCDGAATLGAAMRRDDELYRVGGDEFAALLEVDSSEEAIAIADRLIAAARGTGRFTVSIGIATSTPSGLGASTRVRADAALYEAKHRGRDTVVLFTDPDATSSSGTSTSIDRGVALPS